MQQKEIQDRRQLTRSSRNAVCIFIILSFVLMMMCIPGLSGGPPGPQAEGVPAAKTADQSGEPDALACSASILEEDIADMPLSRVRRIDAYATFFEKAHIDVWPYWMYTGQPPDDDFDKDIVYGCYLLGVISEKTKNDIFSGKNTSWASGTISTGEIVNAATTLKLGRLEQAPGIAKDITIDWDVDMDARNRIMKGLASVEDSIVRAFVKRGWKIQLVPKSQAYAEHPNEVKYIGLCVYREKTIIVVSDSKDHDYTILHEMGHFITGGKLEEYEKIYQQEHSKSVDLLGKYAQTNAKEYIAELYCQIKTHANDPVWLSKVKTTLPQSYAYIMSVIGEYDLKY